MNSESECSALESVEDNDVVVTQGSISHVDDGNVKSNGPYSNEINKLGASESQDVNNVEPVDNHGKSIDSVQPLATSSSAMKSPAAGSAPMTKGYGLKKWRRIKRDVIKDAGPSVDSSKVLKRGLSGSVNPTKPLNLSSAEARQNSEGSLGSVNVVKNVGTVDGFATRSSSLDSRFAVGSAFVAGTDSENSEDQSSKSSTAASAPKMKYELPAPSGYARERNRVKNMSGKSGVNSAQRGKGRAESSKKPRGEKVKTEKENSHSSMESDSRSSNFVFMQGTVSVNSNGKQSGRPMNYDGENSDDAHACELGEELQTGFTKENVGEAEDLSQDDLAADFSWNAKGEKSENHRLSTDQDPLVESILTLQSVQEALEKEVQKFGEIGKDITSPHGNSTEGSSIPADSTFIDPEICRPNSSDKLHSENTTESASSSLEIQVLRLTQNLKFLESRLEESRAMLAVKDARIAELETTFNGTKPLKEESGSTIELQPEKCREMETELEGLFQQKIEAEIEYLALTRTIEKFKVAAADPIALFEEQETLVEEQTQMLNKLGEAESKAEALKKQAEELEKYCGDVFGTEVVLKMQNRVCKVTSCLIIQFTLLLLVFWLFVSQLSPYSGVVVPT